MDLILLPGNSPANKIWVEAVEAALRDLFTTTYIQHYDHWQTGEEIINLDKELLKLEQTTKGLGDYSVLAKSFGVILTLRAFYEKKITPKKCIFLGSAISTARTLWPDVDKWLTNLTVPTLFIHQTSDPVMAAKDLKALLERRGLKNHQFVEIPGNDHSYNDLEKLREVIPSFVLN